MPELPEVETIKNGLSRLLPGHKIVAESHDWEKSFPNPPNDVKQFLIGSKVTGVRRRAKVLLIDLDSKYSLLIHLKMTGQLVYLQNQIEKNGEKRFGAGHPNDSLIGKLPDRSTRVTLELEDMNAKLSHKSRLFFNDQRKFGWMRLIPTAEISTIDFFKQLGPEPLAANFNAKDFAIRLKRRPNATVKSALLDQKIIAGVGNIYADESLWGAKIHPSTLVKDLTAQKLNILFKELQFVLKLSIEKGGSTNKNYVNAEGKKGSYMNFARVFRREGLPCPRCGTTIIKIRLANRGTHLCPKCQKLVRSTK